MDVKIEVIFDSQTGDVYSITQPGMINSDMLESLSVVYYNFKFRPVSYDDMQRYRKQAAFYDSDSGEMVINRLGLRSLFLINHLRETDLVEADGQPFKLEFDEESDNLSLETIQKLYKAIPALLDVVLTLFERKLLILFNVNSQ